MMGRREGERGAIVHGEGEERRCDVGLCEREEGDGVEEERAIGACGEHAISDAELIDAARAPVIEHHRRLGGEAWDWIRRSTCIVVIARVI